MNFTPGERFDRAAGTEPYKPESRALDPRNVTIQPGWNVRDVTSTEARQHIAALKASILQRVNEDPPLPGLIKPIEVRYNRKDGITTLVDGQCRLLACRELWEEGHQIFVPCKVLEGTEEQLFASSLAANGGLPPSQWEIGIGCRKLTVGYGWSIDRIAAHICKTKRYVTEAIALSNVSVEAKAMLAAGTVTPGAVLHAVKENGPEAAATVLKGQVEESFRRAPEPPAQAALPNTPAKPAPKPKPVARPKAPSAKEQIAKKAPNLLELADAMYRLILDPNIELAELELAAKAYGKARGL